MCRKRPQGRRQPEAEHELEASNPIPGRLGRRSRRELGACKGAPASWEQKGRYGILEPDQASHRREAPSQVWVFWARLCIFDVWWGGNLNICQLQLYFSDMFLHFIKEWGWTEFVNTEARAQIATDPQTESYTYNCWRVKPIGHQHVLFKVLVFACDDLPDVYTIPTTARSTHLNIGTLSLLF